ncbi:glycosyltransferase [Acinetobacter haemolyticus]
MDMHYFLNKNIGANLTGIEHAAISRLRIFSKIGIDSKILTVNYNPNLYGNFNKINLDFRFSCNLYHFFQKSRVTIFLTMRTFYENDDYDVKKVNDVDDYRIYDKKTKQYLMYISCFKKTENIFYINFFDSEPKKYKRTLYDSLGFKSKDIFLNDDMSIKYEIYYDSEGASIIEINYKKVQEVNMISSVQLVYNNRRMFFQSEAELIDFWLRIIVESTQQDIFFYVDRNLFFNPILNNMNYKNLKKISIIHSLHISRIGDICKTPLLRGYSIPLENYNKYDAIVVSTHAQKNDIVSRFPENRKISVIQPTFTKSYGNKIKNKSDKFKIVSLGRYFSEKRLDHMIKAIDLVRKEHSNIQLDLYGFPDTRDGCKTFNALKELVKESKLEEVVYFRGYRDDVKDILNGYHVSLLTSRLEGFGIALLDAMSEGVVNIAYDIKYGPSELIIDGEDGFLIENGNIDMLAEKIIFLIKNREIWNDFSEKSKNKSINFSIENMSYKWKDLIDNI